MKRPPRSVAISEAFLIHSHLSLYGSLNVEAITCDKLDSLD